MSAAIRISALGTAIGITLDDTISPDASLHVAQIWESASIDGDLPVEATLSAGLAPRPSDASAVTASDVESLAAMLSTRVTLAAIEKRKSELVMLHACGVALPDGGVVAFVGPSGRGKTTLARNVAQHFSYITDETVGIDISGGVHPYRKPLSVITDETKPHIKTQIPPEQLGLLPLGSEPLRIAAIVLLERDAEHEGPPTAEPVSLRDAILGVVPELSYLPELPQPLQRLAGLLDQVGGVSRLHYREAADVADVVPQLVKQPAQSGWTVVPTVDLDEHVPTGDYARAATLDVLDLGAEYLFLSGRNVHVLDGIGPAIWDALDEPKDLSRVTDAVVARHGAPEGAHPEALVEAALNALSTEGLVRRGS
ncbi:hypothetical protein SCB71_15840 [Herbiconiux sp. KACC 21604]|uniref:PqqD family protein n=1 Tax=unclassified Herbiconiux TaxID=2618217 RepID=UPI0014908FCE|nr:PqqD family protein [Herbiconiux sp. SALV-R1]QJU54592.1 PqqD family peptide modification chaperone [Herbiconiux sp. SALV-R1]WPO85677.1 hypothetical protein SCB71_15840 [Herbiconiux sp. KACC 21604]